MLPAEDIYRSLAGAWRMMMGKADGMRLMDVSADGFWNSFQAIIVALPPFLVGWVAIANDLARATGITASPFSLVLRLATVDLLAWVVPLAVLGMLAGTIGIAGRYVHYVVATNWASAIVVWLMLPPSLMRLFAPDAKEIAAAVSLALFLTTLFFSWRVTNAAIARGPAVASAVFFGMIVLSLTVLFLLQGLFGLTPPDQIVG